MVVDALESRPKGTCQIVIGDLNSDRDFPWDGREEIMSSGVTAMSMTCASKGYRIWKKRQRTHGWWTFQRHNDRGGEG